MNIDKEVMLLKDELIALRRDFHQHPELGFQEYRTAEVIRKYLTTCGIEVKTVAKTGVVGLLRGAYPGPTVMLRADMDALPIQEENEIPYKSINDGNMHACAHDGHMAMLLVAAKVLARKKEEMKGNIKFVFQPNEEEAGARIMIEEGVLKDPKVEAALGIHLWTPLDSGKMGIAPGPVMGAHDNFKILIKGKGGHTSAPHASVDPIITAANVIQTAQIIQTREINALTPTVLMFGIIKGGTTPNVIPESVTLEGTIRYLYDGRDDGQEQPRKRLERIIKSVCEGHRAAYELEIRPSNTTLINDPQLTAMIEAEAAKIVDDKQRDIVPYICMAGEDFSEFSMEVPSTFIFIGTGNEGEESHYPHHHPRFNIDENTMLMGVQMHIKGALAYLSNH